MKIEKRSQDQSCSFRREDCTKNILSLRPGDDGFCSSVTKHDRRMGPKTYFISAGRLHKESYTNKYLRTTLINQNYSYKERKSRLFSHLVHLNLCEQGKLVQSYSQTC
jgi:hypothetical protein